jgi:hypothetical protein
MPGILSVAVKGQVERFRAGAWLKSKVLSWLNFSNLGKLKNSSIPQQRPRIINIRLQHILHHRQCIMVILFTD